METIRGWMDGMGWWVLKPDRWIAGKSVLKTQINAIYRRWHLESYVAGGGEGRGGEGDEATGGGSQMHIVVAPAAHLGGVGRRIAYLRDKTGVCLVVCMYHGAFLT